MQRFLEIMPALTSWGTLGILILLSWLAPAPISIFVILFDIYWLLKTIYLSLHLRASFRRMKENLEIDWLKKLKNFQQWPDMYHLIILPMYKEPHEVVKESFESLIKSNYPKDKFIVALAIEELGSKKAEETAEKIKNEFADKFFKFLITVHPANLPNEIPGKGSNQTHSIKEIKKLIIDPLKIPYEKILTSVFDVDTQVPKNYFGRLTHAYLTAEHPSRSSYQPIPIFLNNIYQAPALARVVSFSSSFWHMIQQSRPERLTTFSSHSMPFKALIEIGFWQTNIVSEDSRIFWQCYLHYNGDWRVVPLDYPVYMDANVAPTFWQTMINIYKQQRRWGWGCENIPYLITGFIKNKKISLAKKIYWGFQYPEGFHSWATNSLIIFMLGWLPLYIGSNNFRFSLLSYSLPQMTKWIMNLTSIGIISSAILSMALLPPKPQWFRFWHYGLYLIQWALMPLTLIIFGAFPALESQTRLALGGKFRLGFWVTPKHRKTEV